MPWHQRDPTGTQQSCAEQLCSPAAMVRGLEVEGSLFVQLTASSHKMWLRRTPQHPGAQSDVQEF